MGRLAGISLLKDASVDLAMFEARSSWRHTSAEETLVDFDEHSSDVYFLVSGEVRVLVRTRSGKEVIFADLRPGEFFGELAALDGTPRSANVTALTRGEVCIMPAKVFKSLVLASPVLTDRLFCLLTRRIRDLSGRVLEHSILDLRHRLYAELLRLSTTRANHPDERVISPPPYHHILAARIGCRREQVTREFTAMDQDGMIERTKGALVLKRPDLFRNRIAGAMREDH